MPDAARLSVVPERGEGRRGRRPSLAPLRGEKPVSWEYFWPLSLMSDGHGVTTNASSALLALSAPPAPFLAEKRSKNASDCSHDGLRPNW